MNYRTYKSRYAKQGLAGFKGEDGNTRFETFEKHTLAVPETDTLLINEIERVMALEKERGGQRTIFTPEEFIEIMTPENAYFEHTTLGKIPYRRVTKMIDFAVANGFTDDTPDITVKTEKKFSQGTRTTHDFDKSKENKR